MTVMLTQAYSTGPLHLITPTESPATRDRLNAGAGLVARFASRICAMAAIPVILATVTSGAALGAAVVTTAATTGMAVATTTAAVGVTAGMTAAAIGVSTGTTGTAIVIVAAVAGTALGVVTGVVAGVAPAGSTHPGP